MSKMGYCSRAQATALIRQGRIRVNGRLARDPEMPVRFGVDSLEFDDARISQQARIYLAMNKPRGLVTTTSDEQGRATVYQLLTPEMKDSLGLGDGWVAPVGRLDKASEGLLLLSNDSEWAAKITDPNSHLDKRYHVQTDCIGDDQLLQRLVRGARAGSEVLQVKHVRVIRQASKTSWLEVTLDEGKNRHIRRLLGALGVEVLRLVRVGIGPLVLGDLKKRGVRRLTPQEKSSIDRALAEKHPQKHNRRVPIDVG